MPETAPTTSIPVAYVPTAAPSAAVEAAHLLAEGQQLLSDARADQAEPLLLRALELYDSASSARTEHVQAEVAALLGSLARLYLHNGRFAEAEPLLQRLLMLKRARGDDHPEVATVLASLATAHSAMGAHESAERILRRVLEIRERTLAPNHFATMTTLEHLAEACAARGKFSEALGLLHRGLAMRERTLGATHPSIDAARTRIADLELLAANEELSATPVWTPAATAVAVAVEQVPVRESTPPIVATLEDEWLDDVDEPRRDTRLLDQLSTKVASAAEFARTPRGRATLLGIGVTSLVGALVLAMKARADVTVTRADAVVAPAQAPVAATTDPTISLDILARSASAERARPQASPTTSRSSAATTTPPRASSSASRANGGASEDAPTPLPTAPRLKAFDAVVAGSASVPAAAPLIAASEFTSPRSSAPGPRTEDVAGDTSTGRLVHATLPATSPGPQYPTELLRRRVEGQVVAEFLVDASGRIDMRTARITSSSHESFSQAVMDLLPRLRFLPAERDGVKTEEWVGMPFRFTVNRE